MTSKDDIVAAIEEVDARIERLRPAILARPEAPLPEGTWRVRDALSHLAARSNGIERVRRRVEALDHPPADGSPAPAPGNIDEINAGQVEERSDRSAQQLLDEIREGHRAAIEAVRGLDDALLAREVPLGFRPGGAPVADLIVMGGPGHDQSHLAQIEEAVSLNEG